MASGVEQGRRWGGMTFAERCASQQEVWAAFDRALEGGMSFTAAARVAGVSKDRARYRCLNIGGMRMQMALLGGLPKQAEPDPVEVPV